MKTIKLILPLLSLFLVNCDNFLDIQPKGEVIPEILEDFRALMTKAYKETEEQLVEVKSKVAFRTDQVKPNEKGGNSEFNNTYKDIYLWNDAAPDINPDYSYQGLYKVIFYVNHILNQGSKTIKASPGKEQLIGEAYALRAYVYFNLINLYGKPYNTETAASKGVPLVLETDAERDFKPQSVQEVYDQIADDLEKSKKHLQLPVQEAGLNYRFSKASYYALDARVNLYMKHYESALKATNKALELKNTLVDLNQKKPGLPDAYNSLESLLALEYLYSTAANSMYASERLVKLYDKENDGRFSIYFSKNKDENYQILKRGYENACSFRVAELYLNKAEALLYLNRIPESKTVLLSLIKNRYKTDAISNKINAINAMDKTAYTAELFAERERELAFELHRWFDLRRTTQQEIYHTYKGKVYVLLKGDPKYTLPFPKKAILRNPFLRASP